MISHDPIPDALMQKIRVMSECDEVREIPGYPLYAITLTGQVWSVQPHGRSIVLPKIPRRMKAEVWKGNEQVKLQGGGNNQHTFSIGRLLLMSFVSEPTFPDAQASPIDGDSFNYTIGNWEWVTNSTRQKKAVKRNGGGFTYGESQWMSKLTPELVQAMKDEYVSGSSFQEIADKYGVTRRTASRAVRGVDWKQAGSGIDSHVMNYAKGTSVRLAKLNPDQVREIRQRITKGESLSSIARAMAVKVGAIWMIKEGKTWKHVV